MADFGYDISDHTDVDPVFGSLDDADTLIAQAHARDLRVVVDFVPNHTSDQPPLVPRRPDGRDRRHIATSTSGATPHPTADPRTTGGPRSRTPLPGRSTRPPGSTTCTCSCPSSPTSTGTTRWAAAGMLDVLRFWLDRGVDGFRADVVHAIGKPADLADAPSELSTVSPPSSSTSTGHPPSHPLDEEPPRLLRRGPVRGRRDLGPRSRADGVLPRTERRAEPTWRSTSCPSTPVGRRRCGASGAESSPTPSTR